MRLPFRRSVTIALFLTLAACASSGVVSTGPNEYLIAKTDMGDVWHQGTMVLAKLYSEANEFCAGKGLAVEKISEDTRDGQVFVRNASASLRFRCVPPRGR